LDDDDLSAMDCASDSDLEDMELDDKEAGIKNDAALLAFLSVLQHAQEIATTAEKKKWGEQKRPKCYAKKSAHTLWWDTQKRHKLATKGQRLISDWVNQCSNFNPQQHP